MLCDEEYNIGGMIDIIFYNKKTNEFQIWDYKTNNNFKFKNDKSN